MGTGQPPARGIDTPLTREIAPDEANFSVGQQQLLSIADIYARDCDIAILDEPSSALDQLAEARIKRNVFDGNADSTVFMTSLRLSTTRDASQMLVLSDGRISERGTHDELMRTNGHYAAAFSAQAQRYEMCPNTKKHL